MSTGIDKEKLAKLQQAGRLGMSLWLCLLGWVMWALQGVRGQRCLGETAVARFAGNGQWSCMSLAIAEKAAPAYHAGMELLGWCEPRRELWCKMSAD